MARGPGPIHRRRAAPTARDLEGPTAPGRGPRVPGGPHEAGGARPPAPVGSGRGGRARYGPPASGSVTRRLRFGQRVADAVDRQHVAGSGHVRLELAAQVLDVPVDRPLVRLQAEAVDRVEQLPAREHAPGLAREGGEELELGRRQGDGPATHGDPMPPQVELEVADDEPLGRSGGVLGPAEDGPDAGDELLRAERLDHVVVGAELEAGHPVGLVAAGGEDHDRDHRVAAEGADDVEAVDLRQAQVEDDRVGLADAGERQGGHAVARVRTAKPACSR